MQEISDALAEVRWSRILMAKVASFVVIIVSVPFRALVNVGVMVVSTDYLKRVIVFFHERPIDGPFVKPRRHLVSFVIGTPVRTR